MDVHAPQEPIHTWRDFFIHLITITIGLLIALGLEGLVEIAHRRHLLHEAEANLRDEMRDNRATLSEDEKQLGGAEQQITHDLKMLTASKAHQEVGEQLGVRWEWNGLQSAAWDTARNTGAIALMPYEEAQRYSIIYRQESLVDDQATAYIRDIYRSFAPLQGTRKLADLDPTERDAITANLQQTLVDLKFLRDLSESLRNIYDRGVQQP